MSGKAKSKNIEEYIKAAPDKAQKRLREMLKCLREAAPDAQEAIKWSVPALSYDRILFTFAAYKNHISLYPTPAAIRAFATDLKDYKTSSSTIQFPLDNPLPRPLVKKIAKYRVKAVLEEGAKWM